MTGCDGTRERLLEADLQELQANHSSDLAIHLRTCEACRSVAVRLAEAEGELREALGELRPPGDDEQAALLAVREARARSLRRPLALVALAAAAGLAALLLFRPAHPSVPASPPPVAQASPLIEAPAGQDVIVYHTTNPKVVVLWLYQRKGT